MDTLKEKLYEIEEISDKDYGRELYETTKKTHRFNNKLQLWCIIYYIIFAALTIAPKFVEIEGVNPFFIRTTASTMLISSLALECISSYKTMIKLIGGVFGVGLSLECVPFDIICGALLAFLCAIIFVFIPPLATMINSKREKMLIKYTKQFL